MDNIDSLFNSIFSDSPEDRRRAMEHTMHTMQTDLLKSKTADRNLLKAFEAMCRENQEMRLRLGVLIRLLVEKGMISTEEYAAKVKEAVDATQYVTLEEPTRAVPTPVVVGKVASRHLPKPPKALPKGPGGPSAL